MPLSECTECSFQSDVSAAGVCNYWSPFWESIVLAMLLSELAGGLLYHLIHNYSSPITIFGTDSLFCSRGFAHFKATLSLGIREVWRRTSCLEGSLQTHKSPGKCAAYDVCIRPIPILPRAFRQLWNVTSYLDCAGKVTRETRVQCRGSVFECF